MASEFEFSSPRGDKLQSTSIIVVKKPQKGFRPLAGINCNTAQGTANNAQAGVFSSPRGDKLQ